MLSNKSNMSNKHTNIFKSIPVQTEQYEKEMNARIKVCIS